MSNKQVKTLLHFIKTFREHNDITDEEFASQLADGIIDGEDADPHLADTFLEHFMGVMRQTRDTLESRLWERHMRS